MNLKKYNVIWDTPGYSSTDSMPLGNGDIGINVWVENEGDLLFYISKTDAWDENMRLLKLGRIRVNISPNPFREGLAFKQVLSLEDGAIYITAGKPEIKIKLRVDANNPVIRLEAESEMAFELKVILEVWRSRERVLQDYELKNGAYGLDGSTEPVIEYPDTILDGEKNRIIWYHRNKSSIWPCTLKLQGLESIIDELDDPLLNRTFGGIIKSDSLENINPYTLKSLKSKKQYCLSIYPFTSEKLSSEEWLESLEKVIDKVESINLTNTWESHKNWWLNFWGRSCIFVSGSSINTKEVGETKETKEIEETEGTKGREGTEEIEITEEITRGYILQRFVNACGGRGSYPIKFNGSIFTMDSFEEHAGERFNADYRRWGGPYWFQNTRLTYWPMLGSGDYELIKPLFSMYMDMLKLAKKRTQIYYGHDGVFFPETLTFWGTYANSNYGWDRKGKHISHVDNTYIRYYWQCGIELVCMMLEYYFHTLDELFVQDTLLPLANEVILFNSSHYSKGEDGKVIFKPASSLETWQNVVNPLPEIAGLKYILEKLLELPEGLLNNEQKENWEKLFSELPTIPIRKSDDKKLLAPAQELIDKKSMNIENPELYAVFPYRIYGVGKPDLEIAIDTYESRLIKRTGGWHQDAIQAAFLGMIDEAAKNVISNYTSYCKECRFPGFRGPNYDWTPDQDHASVANMALQCMLLQTEGEKIYLFPAWPDDWDVEFKLHAPMNTVVEARLKDKKLEYLKVTPDIREKDVIIMNYR